MTASDKGSRLCRGRNEAADRPFNEHYFPVRLALQDRRIEAAELAARPEAFATIVEYREAVHLDPNDAEKHFNLGLVLRAHGQKHEALEEFRLARELAPGTLHFESAYENLRKELNR